MQRVAENRKSKRLAAFTWPMATVIYLDIQYSVQYVIVRRTEKVVDFFFEGQ